MLRTSALSWLPIRKLCYVYTSALSWLPIRKLLVYRRQLQYVLRRLEILEAPVYQATDATNQNNADDTSGKLHCDKAKVAPVCDVQTAAESAERLGSDLGQPKGAADSGPLGCVLLAPRLNLTLSYS